MLTIARGRNPTGGIYFYKSENTENMGIALTLQTDCAILYKLIRGIVNVFTTPDKMSHKDF